MMYVLVKGKEKQELFIAKGVDLAEARRLANTNKDLSVYGMMGRGEIECLITNPIVFVKLTIHNS